MRANYHVVSSLQKLFSPTVGPAGLRARGLALASTIDVSAVETAQATITLTVYASDAEGLALGTLQLWNGSTDMSSWFS